MKPFPLAHVSSAIHAIWPHTTTKRTSFIDTLPLGEGAAGDGSVQQCATPFGQQEAVLKATAVRNPLPAGNVVDSSLSSLSSPQGRGGTSGGSGREGGSGRGRGSGRGEGVRGQGTFHPPCHMQHHHMVLRPEGTSHNEFTCGYWTSITSRLSAAPTPINATN